MNRGQEQSNTHRIVWRSSAFLSVSASLAVLALQGAQRQRLGTECDNQRELWGAEDCEVQLPRIVY